MLQQLYTSNLRTNRRFITTESVQILSLLIEFQRVRKVLLVQRKMLEAQWDIISFPRSTFLSIPGTWLGYRAVDLSQTLAIFVSYTVNYFGKISSQSRLHYRFHIVNFTFSQRHIIHKLAYGY